MNPSFLDFSRLSVAESLRSMMELILFNMTLTCTIVLAFNLLVVELNGTINLEIFVAFVDLGVVLGLTIGYYYPAEWITSDLLMIGDHFYESYWYRLPAHQQKLLVLPIQRAQRELRLKGLGLFECSLSVFLTVNCQCLSWWLKDPNWT